MHNIRDILHKKGTVVWSTTPDATVLEAIRRMAEHGVGALLVMENDQLTGLFLSNWKKSDPWAPGRIRGGP